MRNNSLGRRRDEDYPLDKAFGGAKKNPKQSTSSGREV
jgi:hypothetical protein